MERAAQEVQQPVNILLLIILFAVIGYFMAFPPGTRTPTPEDEDLRKKYKFNIPANQEKGYKIDRLICKGIPGIDVDAVKVSRFGIKYDREWSVFYKNDKMGPVYLSPELKFVLLRQRFERDPATKQKYLVISICDEGKAEAAKLSSPELRIPIKKRVTGEIIQTPKFEGSMQEARIANTMLRLVGYCSRCKAVTCNFSTNEYNPEQESQPVSTLNQFRKNDLGTLFGTYHQIEIISSQDQFRRLLRDYAVPRDRALQQEFSIIKKGDELKVRVAEQRIGFETKK